MLVVEGVFGRHGHAEVGEGAVDGADLAGGDDVADVDGEGEVAGPDLVGRDCQWCFSSMHCVWYTHCLHKEEVLLLGDLDQSLQLGGIGGEGLLAEDILAGLETESHVLVVVAVRCCDVYDVDVRVLHKLLVGAIGLGSVGGAHLFEEVLGALCG